jgi:hypothetical protein
MRTQTLDIDREALLAQVLRGEFPDTRGRFGPFGGRYVPETLVPALDRLEDGVRTFLNDAAFRAEFEAELRGWIGRPTPLTYAHELSRRWGADAWLKREDLAHTPARTRSTTRSARRCSRSGSVQSGSSPRPALASTAWHRPRHARASASRASSTWARSTSSGRRRTSVA